MTYRELKEALAGLTEAQLDQDVLVTGEERCAKVGEVLVLAEDYINPTGEGMEPASEYADDPDYKDEPVVARKGDVFLREEEK